ncbi:MAG: hypothetical protein FWD05_09215 [Oscillospiraceae bacterium]|nr:hypothetical protein [Oscillospiraceae bacterium]
MRTRNTHINIRTTPQEKAQYQRYAQKCGLPLSEYLRKLASGYEPQSAPTKEYVELIYLLRNIYSDFQESGDYGYAKLLADVLLEFQATLNPVKNNGNNKNMAGA